MFVATQVNNHFPLRKYYNKFQSFYPLRKYRLVVALSAAAGLWIDIVLLEESLPHGRVFKATDKGISNQFSTANSSPNIYKGAVLDYVAAKMLRRPTSSKVKVEPTLVLSLQN